MGPSFLSLGEKNVTSGYTVAFDFETTERQLVVEVFAAPHFNRRAHRRESDDTRAMDDLLDTQNAQSDGRPVCCI